MPTEKNFGYTISIFLMLISFLPLIKANAPNTNLAFCSFVLALITLFKADILKVPNLIWYKFGQMLNKIISPIVLFGLYFLIFFPIGILLKIVKKDVLGLKINKKLTTYWVTPDKNKLNMKEQF
jgi:hypothetical protein